jgi:hypothetical protein
MNAFCWPFQMLDCHMANHSPPTTMKPKYQIKKPIVAAMTANFLAPLNSCPLAEAVEALDLGADCAVGDLVSLTHAGTPHDFAIIRRRWINNEGGVRLELTLDHPAR